MTDPRFTAQAGIFPYGDKQTLNQLIKREVVRRTACPLLSIANLWIMAG